MTEAIQQAHIIRVTDLTPHVREVVLLPEQNISYRPGQWISIKVPLHQKSPLNRAYSMAVPEQPSRQLFLVFDRVPGGTGSEYLYSLRPGDQVLLSGPYGKFLLPAQNQKALLLIGRYTGIVPIHCMVRALVSNKEPIDLTVIQAAPVESELLYHEEFIGLRAARADFQYIPIISPSETELDRVMELVSKLMSDRHDIAPMICGIKQFVRPMRAFFVELGFDRRDVKIETYD